MPSNARQAVAPLNIQQLLAAKQMGLGDYIAQAEMKSRTPSLRERIGNLIYDAAQGAGLRQSAHGMRSNAETAVGFVPGLGDAVGAQEAGRDLGAGNYLSGGLGLAATLVPGAIAEKAVKKVAKKAADVTEPLFDAAYDLTKVPDVPQFDLPRNIPARGVSQRVKDITSNKELRAKMLATIQQGVDMGGARWYNAEPLRGEFVKELGEEKGNKAFRKYMDLVAATSPRSEVGANVRNASYYYTRDAQGLGAPAVGDKNPQPYGHMAQRLHQMNVGRVLGKGWDPLNNPKPASFVENLAGNQQPATIDTHAFRLPAILAEDPRFLETAFESSKGAPKQNVQKMVASGEMALPDAVNRAAFWQSKPNDNEYAAMEQYYKGLGEELGLTPAQTQAAAWVGGGKITGLASDESKPFIGFFEDRVKLTAQKLGITPREVLQKFIRGEQPLLTLAPVGLGLGALMQSGETGQGQ
jgi:hypothetical protein